MSTLYEVIKSKTTVSTKDSDGNLLYNRDGFVKKKEVYVYYIKKDGLFIRDKGNVYSMIITTFLLVGFFSCLISALINNYVELYFVIGTTISITSLGKIYH